MKYLIILFIILCTNIIINGQSHLICDRKSDSLELLTLFQHFKGNLWNDNTNWLKPNQPMDTWKGIQLNTDGCVEQLILDSNYIDGEFYEFNLPNLHFLSMRSNQITGSIPDFSKLTNLDTLDLSDNQLSNKLPDFSNLLNLHYLNLSDNQLSGPIPNFSKLTSLTDLVLSFNTFSGNVPDFKNLPSLLVLVVHGNQLTGTIPDFSNIPNLTNLLAGYNQLSGSIPDFSNLHNLYQLNLIANQFTGSIPDFSGMPDLGVLQISDNKLSGTIPDFSNFQNLYVLNAGHNELTGEIPDFANIPFLNWLTVSGNQLTGSIPDYNSSKVILTELDVDNNFLSGTIPNYPQLQSFFVFNNKFTFSDIFDSHNLGLIPEFYYAPQKPFYKDTTIRIARNVPFTIDLGIDSAVTDNYYFWYKDSIFWFPPFPNDFKSNKLIFSDPEITDAARYYTSVTNFSAPYLNLKSYTISLRVCDEQSDSMELVKLYNSTDGTHWKNNSNWLQSGTRIQSWYGVKADSFGCVEKLDLTDNNLNGTIPELSMNTLDTLILNNNLITGNIPEFQTPFIKWIELGNNSINGDFPKNIGKLHDLNGLNLSANGITGEVPPDLGDLCELKMLRINKNKIVGELPEQLTMLVKLQIGQVNFSDNNIDSLKDKLIWFCPFGDTILETNPSYNRFLGICNVECSGNEFRNLKSFPWIIDTIQHLNCQDSFCVLSTAQAGFVNVRNLSVFYTLSRCYQSVDPPPIFTDIVKFYDCGGHLLETVKNDVDSFYAEHGAIIKSDFDSLKFDIQWQCGQTLDISTEAQNPNQTSKNSSQKILSLNCYPVPTNSNLYCVHIDHPLVQSIRFTDILGKQYYPITEFLNDKIQIDLSSLQKGIYFVALKGKDGYYSGKIVVE